ncbi:g705 [Coccomyxa viridis]|uniref:G705 protein n=1 Tax=Coccomyxa viridis TaxID=1274662 RepID=A0ABP1FLL9_9CHLO
MAASGAIIHGNQGGVATLLGAIVVAGPFLQLQLPGTTMPPVTYTHWQDILEKHVPEWFPFDMTEAAARFFVTPIILAGVTTTTAVLELGQHELTFSAEVPVTGNVAQGCINYLIKGPQGSLPVKVIKTKDLFTPANQGSLLVQMAAVRDQTVALPNNQASDATPSIPRNRLIYPVKSDIFGVLTNGQEWGLYKYEQGGDSVSYEVYGLSISQEHEVFLAHLDKLLAALVGILRYQAGAVE